MMISQIILMELGGVTGKSATRHHDGAWDLDVDSRLWMGFRKTRTLWWCVSIRMYVH